ncbi:hypothetical protein Mapa_006821 [Marchantia paleacea]|nr:hypothetical protein Mapa_006821 [Marchantia paleacea]
MGTIPFPSTCSLLPNAGRSSIIRFPSTVLSRSLQTCPSSKISRRVVRTICSVTGDNVLPSIPAEGFTDKEVHITSTNREQPEDHEKVIISTERSSRTAQLLQDEREYVSERYVRGSVKYQIELEQSFRVGNPISEDESEGGDSREDAESLSGLGGDSDGTGEVSTSGKDEGTWSSETYLRQLLMQRWKSKQVILNVSTEDTPFLSQIAVPTSEVRIEDSRADAGASLVRTDMEDKPVDEDELILRRALKKKRAIAEETLESALRAGGLGPTYCRDVMARLSPFVDRILTEAVYLKKVPAYKYLSFNSRARLYLDQSRVVDLIKWLKHQNLSVPRIGSLICLADENLGRIKPRIEVLKSIYVKGRELGVVIEREPSILDQSLAEIHNTIQILETAGVERKWLGLVVSRSPRVFSVGSDELLQKISMFTDLGISPEDFGLLVFKFPAVLGHLSVEEMLSKVDYLEQIGLEDDVLRRVIVSTPQLLACSIGESWDKLLRYFYFLRIELSGIRRILGVQPEVFCLNLADNIAPKVRFLRAIGVRDEIIGQVIVSFPAILTYSLDKKIRPVVSFFWKELELPRRMWASIPTLHPKIRYFKRVMKRPLDDIIAFPRYFSYSLKTRIIPRHELLVKRGLTFSLKHMLACSDETFNLRVAAAESRFLEPGKMTEEVESNVDCEQDDVIGFNDEIQNVSVLS